MFSIKNKHLRKKAILPAAFVCIFAMLIIISLLASWLFNGSLSGGLLLSAFFSIFCVTGWSYYNKTKKLDELMSRKTIHNYMKINKITETNKIYCSNCHSNRISSRNHVTKAFREFYCSMCGEPLYYVERKDFI